MISAKTAQAIRILAEKAISKADNLEFGKIIVTIEINDGAVRLGRVTTEECLRPDEIEVTAPGGRA